MLDSERRSIIPPVPPPKRHPYDQWSPDARALDLVGDKWTLLIIRDLAAGPRRFVELQRVLPGISTEQLRSRLNRMVADGLLTRQRYREVPPRVDYELTERSRELMPVLGATQLLIAKLNSMDERACDMGRIIPAARAVREQVDWARVAEAVAGSDLLGKSGLRTRGCYGNMMAMIKIVAKYSEKASL